MSKFVAQRWVAVAAVMLLGSNTASHAGTILTFAQTTSANAVTATENSAGTQTTLTVSAAPVSGTYFTSPTALGMAFTGALSLNATSMGVATTATNGFISEEFSGTFSITNGGTNFLSGTFTDEITAKNTGGGLSASTPPPTAVTFTSSVIPATQLGVDRAISLSFTNISPNASVVGTSLASFVSNISGNFSADPTPATPEPASVISALVGLPVIGLIARKRRRAKLASQVSA